MCGKRNAFKEIKKRTTGRKKTKVKFVLTLNHCLTLSLNAYKKADLKRKMFMYLLQTLVLV